MLTLRLLRIVRSNFRKTLPAGTKTPNIIRSCVSATVRELLRRLLPSQSYQYVRQSVRFCRWCRHFYLPRLAASFFVRSTSKVQGFSGDHTSELVQRLRGINVFAPTTMCHVMTWHGSDKGLTVSIITLLFILSSSANSAIRPSGSSSSVWAQTNPNARFKHGPKWTTWGISTRVAPTPPACAHLWCGHRSRHSVRRRSYQDLLLRPT